MAIGTQTSLATKPVYASLPVEDLDRARRFYGETLGLEVEDVGQGFFLVHAGAGSRLGLFKTDMSHPSGNTVASWIVDDVRATVDELRSHGVRFEDYDLPYLKTVDGIAPPPMGPAAWFKDSEGNILSIAQM